MTEVQLMSYVLRNGGVSSSEIAKEYGIRIDHAYQVLRRLEKKGLLKRDPPEYSAKFRLTDKARQISQRVKESDGNLGVLIFLGLAFAILLLATAGSGGSDKESDKENDKEKYPVF